MKSRKILKVVSLYIYHALYFIRNACVVHELSIVVYKYNSFYFVHSFFIVRMRNEVTKLKAELEAYRRMIRARDMEMMSNRSLSAVQNEELKIDLKAAQQEKSQYKEKCEELEIERQEIEFQMKYASDKLEREMKMVQSEENMHDLHQSRP